MLAYAQFPGDTVETAPEVTPEITPEPEHPETTGAIDPGPEAPNIALIVSIAVLAAALVAVALTVMVRRARKRREDEADTVCRANDLRFCHICGARIDPSGSRYCPKCGAILPSRTDRGRGGFSDDL